MQSISSIVLKYKIGNYIRYKKNKICKHH